MGTHTHTHIDTQDTHNNYERPLYHTFLRSHTMGAQSQNIGMHIGAFVLAWTAGSLFLAAILSPHWAEAVNSQSEAVSSLKRTHGLFERCSYLPTGQIECYPVYDHESQWTTTFKALMLTSFGMMLLSSFAILAGGNCTNIAYQEMSEVQGGKATALLAAGGAAGVAGVLSMVTLILMSIQISDGSIFAQAMLGSFAQNDGVSEGYGVIVYKGISFVLCAIGCGLCFVVTALAVMAGLAGRKGADKAIDASPYDDYRPYAAPGVRDAREPLIEATGNGSDNKLDYI